MPQPASAYDTTQVSPLQRRALEVDVAEAFLVELTDRLGAEQADDVFAAAVGRLADAGAQVWRERFPDAGLAELWEVWSFLGGEGRLDLVLDELSETTLRFHVVRCAYADMYRARGQERIGVEFSCRRDAPFARALVPGVVVAQSKTLLQGSLRCEFTYTLEVQ